MPIQIDAGMNFILWLIGKDYNPTSFFNRYSGSRLKRGCRRKKVAARRLFAKLSQLGMPVHRSRYWSLAGTAAKKIVSRIHKRSTTTPASTPVQVAEAQIIRNAKSIPSKIRKQTAREKPL